jgi:hypothetical protein
MRRSHLGMTPSGKPHFIMALTSVVWVRAFAGTTSVKHRVRRSGLIPQ